MREIKKYQCEFCNKSYSSKRVAENHESNKCFFNPDTKSCVTCEFLLAVSVDQNYLEGGEDRCNTYYEIVCEENHGIVENDDFPWEEDKKHFAYQTNCPFWKKLESVGTYKFGRVLIKKD
jgi:hypothetical protein